MRVQTWRDRAAAGFLGTMVTLAGIMMLAGCGGSQSAVSYERIDQRKQEIAVLWGQIRAWRQSAGLKGVEPPRGEILKMQDQSVSTAKQTCPADVEPEIQSCKDVCSLAEAICENAESICRIADELAGDSWAQDKCSSAKASCKEAKQACCRCQSHAATSGDEQESTFECTTVIEPCHG